MAHKKPAMPQKSKRGILGVVKSLFSYSPKLKLPTLFSLVLAALGAILTIIGPEQLKNVTNLISSSLHTFALSVKLRIIK